MYTANKKLEIFTDVECLFIGTILEMKRTNLSNIMGNRDHHGNFFKIMVKPIEFLIGKFHCKKQQTYIFLLEENLDIFKKNKIIDADLIKIDGKIKFIKYSSTSTKIYLPENIKFANF